MKNIYRMFQEEGLILWGLKIRVAVVELKHGGSDEKIWPSVHRNAVQRSHINSR
jgi:hypothetical protein